MSGIRETISSLGDAAKTINGLSGEATLAFARGQQTAEFAESVLDDVSATAMEWKTTAQVASIGIAVVVVAFVAALAIQTLREWQR